MNIYKPNKKNKLNNKKINKINYFNQKDIHKCLKTFIRKMKKLILRIH